MRKTTRGKVTFSAVLACLIAGWPLAYGEGDWSDGITHIMETDFSIASSDSLRWERNVSVPAGMLTVMIYGNPKQPGPYIFRAKMAAGYNLPPHRHPDDRTVTVLTGEYWSGSGEEYDEKRMKEFRPGAFYVTKAGTPHFAWARTDVIIQESGTGPGTGIEYVNSKDDPRHK